MTSETEEPRVNVFVEDQTGNKRRQARIAANAPVRDLIPALISALGLPATDSSGRAVTYHLAFGGRQLQSDETLAGANILNGATVNLVPEMTAGQ